MAYPAAAAAALILLAGCVSGLMLASRQLAYDAWPEAPPPDAPKPVGPTPSSRAPALAPPVQPARRGRSSPPKLRKKEKNGQGEANGEGVRSGEGATPNSYIRRNIQVALNFGR